MLSNVLDDNWNKISQLKHKNRDRDSSSDEEKSPAQIALGLAEKQCTELFLDHNVQFLQVVVWINYLFVIALLGFLSLRFLSWFKSNHNLVVLAYSLAIMMISINAGFTVLYVTDELTGKPTNIQSELTPLAPYSSVYNVFNSGYAITSVMSFMLTWIATVLAT